MLKNGILTYISLFSSSGVGCFGFKQEKYECIVTNEIIERRLNIQKINKKCKYEQGYILGDIKEKKTKDSMFREIEKWESFGNDGVDVVVATPPCQGMSVANHKKNSKDLNRNSLINESVKLIKEIMPKIFIFENVSSFWNTGCLYKGKEIMPIGEMILKELGNDYIISKEVINFKKYGSNSSRTRTLVIGVSKKISENILPAELFPDLNKEKTLFEVIGKMPSLNWGEYNKDDFYHSFRTYPHHMENWIKDLKQGESAFSNIDDINKPHRIINGKLVINKNKNAGKYTRQIYSKIAPCIHTRNDQLASQNTIHPVENRVFSIRELMELMTIPKSFKWSEFSLSQLNKLSQDEKRKVSKNIEINIRQSIGEAVPTSIFRQIAKKISFKLKKKHLNFKEINKLILEKELKTSIKLLGFLKKNKDNFDIYTLLKIIELSNFNRESNSAFFTDNILVQEMVNNLPEFGKKEINILEPSVGAGNFLPLIFKKYENVERVNLVLVDLDKNILNIVKMIFKNLIPDNFRVKYICEDFLEYKSKLKFDLIIGNPPFTKLKGEYLKVHRERNYNKKSSNLAEMILDKTLNMGEYISLIMPKNIINTPEFDKTREKLEKFGIEKIIDFGEKGFKGVLIETIGLFINTVKEKKYIEVKSISKNEIYIQKKSYIFDKKYPYWIIYRNDIFDKVAKKLVFNIFNVFRDRQITNQNLISEKKINFKRVLRSRNLSDDGQEILDIEGYDAYIDEEILKKMSVFKYIDMDNIYMTPNMTYKPRVCKKSKGYIVNGSIALLIPKEQLKLNKEQLNYFSTDEFRNFYKIARNYQTRSLNIDKSSVFWFGIKKGEEEDK